MYPQEFISEIYFTLPATARGLIVGRLSWTDFSNGSKVFYSLEESGTLPGQEGGSGQ